METGKSTLVSHPEEQQPWMHEDVLLFPGEAQSLQLGISLPWSCLHFCCPKGKEGKVGSLPGGRVKCKKIFHFFHK